LPTLVALAVLPTVAARAAAARAVPPAAAEKPAGSNPFGLPAGGAMPDLSKLQLPGGGLNLPKPPAGPPPRRRG
ncbi:MAG: SDR family oxidoreductase, partial [Actinomycetota bacterium]